MLSAFVLIDSEPGQVGRLAAELADVPGVAEVYSVAGECDIVVIVRVRPHDELAEVVTARIGTLAGIVATRTMVASYSAKDLEALWDLG